jgi:hypothetical protein
MPLLFRACVLLALLLIVFVPVGLGQGSRKDDIVLNRLGQPVAGASVTVCTSGATGTPCSPLASIFSDVALSQPLSNPLTSDGQGNYHFYALPGRYMLQISGAGVTTITVPDVLLPADPTSPSYQSLTVTQNISALNLNLSGNLSVTGGVSSPSTLSAPQQGSTAPVQIGPHWYPPTSTTATCSVPAAPAVTTETFSSGTGNFSSATTYYVKVTLYNRNGQTTASPATAYTPASGSTNRMLVQLSDFSFRSGCYGYRVWVSSNGSSGTYYPAQAWTLPAASISSWSRNAAGLVTVTTSASHGLIPGEYITISGAATGSSGTSINNGGSNPAGWTLVAQQGSSLTTLFFFQPGKGADSAGSGGTGTVIAGLGSDSFGHMAPGDFIVATVPTSGSAPPTTNTAAIDPDQAALNATCNYATNACAGGQLVVPQGSITKTTPLIVSGQETVVGVNTGGAGGKSELNCAAMSDLNLGCIMVMGTANGVRISGLDIEASCNGIMVTGWGPGFGSSNSFFTNNQITTTSLAGQCAPIRYHSGTWYEHHWDGNLLNGDLADVIFEGISGGVTTFANARWNAANLSASGLSTNGFLSVSGVTDPDRAALRAGFPNGTGLTEFSNFYVEQGTGIQFECVNVACKLRNVQGADSTAISGTPAIFRYGCDANSAGSNWGVGSVIEDSYLAAASGVAAAIQALPAGSCMVLTVRGSLLGGNPNDIDFNNVGGEVNIEDSTTHAWEGATIHKVVNATTTTRLNVKGTFADGTSDSGWAMHLFNGGIRYVADNAYGSANDADLYFEPYNYTGSRYGEFWFHGNPATAANLYRNCQFNNGATCTWLQNDGATSLFNVNATNGANQINLCNPSSPANSKINLGCPLVDSTGATVKGALTGTTASLGGSALSAGSCTSGTVSVTGATTSMAVSVSPAADPGAGFSWMGFVSSSGTVTVRLCAIAAGTPTATTYNVRVIQ